MNTTLFYDLCNVTELCEKFAEFAEVCIYFTCRPTLIDLRQNATVQPDDQKISFSFS